MSPPPRLAFSGIGRPPRFYLPCTSRLEQEFTSISSVPLSPPGWEGELQELGGTLVGDIAMR